MVKTYSAQNGVQSGEVSLRRLQQVKKQLVYYILMDFNCTFSGTYCIYSVFHCVVGSGHNKHMLRA